VTTSASTTDPAAGATKPEPDKSKSGRDLPAAIAVGAGLGLVALLSLFVYKPLFVALAGVVILLGVFELARALAGGGVVIAPVPLVVGAGVTLLAGYGFGSNGVVAGVAVAAVVVGGMRAADPRGDIGRDLMASLFVIVYVALAGGFAMLLVREDDGPWRIVTWILVVVANDVGGYAVGVKLGKTPMAPSVSPAKSWEGFAGSIAFGVLFAVIGVTWFLGGSWLVGVILGVALIASATLGDLTESLIKRDLGLKDMSDLLPGHGGVMDRVDSIILSAPVAWLILTLFVPVS
jgi:phosphatidate cytidylyltransferase